jgi:hypothetical protein
MEAKEKVKHEEKLNSIDFCLKCVEELINTDKVESIDLLRFAAFLLLLSQLSQLKERNIFSDMRKMLKKFINLVY